MDKARAKTDKILMATEREIADVYNSLALRRVMEEFEAFMKGVRESTQASYIDYLQETDRDIKAEKKKAYMSELRKLTVESRDYNKLVDKIARALAEANQEATDVSNRAMRKIYVENYNQMAEECENAGIKVEKNGRQEKKLAESGGRSDLHAR